MPGGLTPASVVAASPERLEVLLQGVSFHRRKAMYLRTTAQQLLAEHSGDIPPDIAGLCRLSGVGMKMATICMAVAHGRVTGVGVDTHVHRIANRLGWVQTDGQTPEHTRRQLEAWVPRPLWGELNLLLVGFGQQICKPVGPLCHMCPNLTLCPAAAATAAGVQGARDVTQDEHEDAQADDKSAVNKGKKAKRARQQKEKTTSNSGAGAIKRARIKVELEELTEP